MGREEYATHEAHGGAGTSGGHGQHGGDAGHSEDMFKRPFWVSLVLTIPVLVYAELLQEALGYAASCLIPACLTASGRRDTGLIMTV